MGKAVTSGRELQGGALLMKGALHVEGHTKSEAEPIPRHHQLVDKDDSHRAADVPCPTRPIYHHLGHCSAHADTAPLPVPGLRQAPWREIRSHLRERNDFEVRKQGAVRNAATLLGISKFVQGWTQENVDQP